MKKQCVFKKIVGLLLGLSIAIIVLNSCGDENFWDVHNNSSEFSNDIVAAYNFGGGNGTQNSPYLIKNVQQLKKLVVDVNYGNNYANTYFKLMTDIQVTANEWTPIGYYNTENKQYIPFSGNFDGNDHIINGTMKSDRFEDFGFFGCCLGDVRISNLTINSTVRNECLRTVNTGAIAGIILNGATISYCRVTGTVGDKYYGTIGGIAGTAADRCSIIYCCVTSDVNGKNNAGGVVGEVVNDSNVTNCYFTGMVNGGYKVGGIAGWIETRTIINNCYAAGICLGGGIVGVGGNFNGSVTNCVALNTSVRGGRIIGDVIKSTFTNNWARNDMIVTINDVTKTLNKGSSTEDGADCAAIPTASWWTTAAPNGPGWSTNDWTFANGQLPKLRWQQ